MVGVVHDELGKTPMLWSPLEWDPAAPPASLARARATLVLWTGDLDALAFNITRTGANALVAAPEPWWYLDEDTSVDDMYARHPRDACPSCSGTQLDGIVGGEACMWATNVDATNLFSTVWPRLTAVAERLWTPPDARLDLLEDSPNEMRRLRLARCRLLARGLPVPPAGGMLYDPDASHRSFAAAREWQWCEADNQFGAYEPDDT